MNKWQKFGAFARSKAGKVSAVVGGLAFSGMAAAQDSGLSADIIAELTSGKAEVKLVLAAIASLIALMVLWSYIRRSAK